jgi:hypothetical protein
MEFAVWEFGLDAIEQGYVVPAILGTSDDVGRWVGCGPEKRRLGLGVGYSLITNRDILIYLDPFSDAPADKVFQYWVVVGRLKQNLA